MWNTDPTPRRRPTPAEEADREDAEDEAEAEEQEDEVPIRVRPTRPPRRPSRAGLADAHPDDLHGSLERGTVRGSNNLTRRGRAFIRNSLDQIAREVRAGRHALQVVEHRRQAFGAEISVEWRFRLETTKEPRR